MKPAICSPNFRDLAICPRLVNKTAIAATGRPRSLRFASLGTLLREARPATPQRQNDGSEREGGCRRSFGRHPENSFGKPDGPAPSARITERARATARVCHGRRGSFGRRPESFGKPNGPAPSAKITQASASDAPLPGCRGSVNRRRESFSREARRAPPQRQNDGNELSGSPTGQTKAQTFDASSRHEKWHATRPGRVSANPKP